MKAFSLLLLLSSCFVLSTHCNEQQDVVDVSTEESRGCGDFRCQSASLSSEFTWETIEKIVSMAIEIRRDGADDAMWERICDVVEQEVPHSNAREVGAELDVLACAIARGDRTLQEWDVTIKSVIERCQQVVARLEKEECSGVFLQVILHNNKAE